MDTPPPGRCLMCGHVLAGDAKHCPGCGEVAPSVRQRPLAKELWETRKTLASIYGMSAFFTGVAGIGATAAGEFTFSVLLVDVSCLLLIGACLWSLLSSKTQFGMGQLAGALCLVSTASAWWPQPGGLFLLIVAETALILAGVIGTLQGMQLQRELAELDNSGRDDLPERAL